jgi:uncharacterized protein (TIGR03067 family)
MFAAIIALSLSASAAEPPKENEKDLPEAAQKELKKLEGKWKLTAGNRDEQERPPSQDGSDVFFEFKGRKVILTERDKEAVIFETAAIDEKTTPKVIDFKMLVERGPLTKGTVYEAIYKLDGDTLKLAIYFGEGKKRPEKFESPKDSAIVVLTMKRVKD